MATKDYYSILGIDRNSSAEDIKKAYRKMSKKYHPDVQETGNEEKFKEVSEAYEVLSDIQKKSNYDNYGSPDGNPFGGGGDPFGGNPFGGDMNDFINQFFGRGQRSQRPQQRSGSDLRVSVKVTLNEILVGVKKKIKYKKYNQCKPCSGKGGTDIQSCTSCGGAGRIRHVQQTPFGTIQQESICHSCEGSGQEIKVKCTKCKGMGVVQEDSIIDIDIPKGISSEMSLNLRGSGNWTRNGLPGNLIVQIIEENHPFLIREGNNLRCEESISIPDAILGCKKEIETLTGKVSINIEPGMYSGQTFKLTGKGLPDVTYNHMLGDQYVKININVPKEITSEEREILEKLKNMKNFS